MFLDPSDLFDVRSSPRSTGLLIGSLSALLCRVHSHSLRRIMTATPVIGHANTIPFMLVGLIVSKEPRLAGCGLGCPGKQQQQQR